MSNDKFATVTGRLVTPTAISRKVRLNALTGERIVLGNAGSLVVAFPASKAWRIREYLASVEKVS